jgi:hypothetical protein
MAGMCKVLSIIPFLHLFLCLPALLTLPRLRKHRKYVPYIIRPSLLQLRSQTLGADGRLPTSH